MRPRISITGSVRTSVGRLVTLSSKTREINIFSHYRVLYYPVEVSVRGQITKKNRARLKSMTFECCSEPKSILKPLIRDCSKLSLLSSFSIFSARKEPAWSSPGLLKARWIILHGYFFFTSLLQYSDRVGPTVILFDYCKPKFCWMLFQCSLYIFFEYTILLLWVTFQSKEFLLYEALWWSTVVPLLSSLFS